MKVQATTNVKIGQAAMVECEISGNPRPIMLWASMRGDNSTFEHTMEVVYSSDYTWTLTLKIITVENSTLGNYECAAENNHGSDSKTTLITDPTYGMT